MPCERVIKLQLPTLESSSEASVHFAARLIGRRATQCASDGRQRECSLRALLSGAALWANMYRAFWCAVSGWGGGWDGALALLQRQLPASMIVAKQKEHFK